MQHSLIVGVHSPEGIKYMFLIASRWGKMQFQGG